MDKSIDLAIVIVSWNVWDLLRACLSAIEDDSTPTHDPRVRRFGPHGEAALHVTVVDNASSDATPGLLPGQFPWVKAILSDENVGFSRGNNLGLADLGFGSKGEQDQPERVAASALPRFVYFLNPDTEVLPNSLWTLYQAIENDDRVGAVGPLVLYGDGARQSTRRRFPSRFTGFFESTWLGRMWPNNVWQRRYHMADWPDTVRQDVDWLVGAALLVRGSALAQVGGFDSAFFMYSEELDLCKRLKRVGWRIVYDPAAIVIHYEARSSDQVSTLRYIRFNCSKVLYYRKYFGRFWSELLRHFLLTEFRWQIMVESVKAAIGHRRALRQARVAAYREVVATGLRPAAAQAGRDRARAEESAFSAVKSLPEAGAMVKCTLPTPAPSRQSQLHTS